MSVAPVLLLIGTACGAASAVRPSAADRIAAPPRGHAERLAPLLGRLRDLRALRRGDVGADLATATASLAAHIRAGGSAEDGFASVGRSMQGRVGAACREIAERLAFGEPFGVALDRWSADVGTAEAALLATTLRMHRRAGGSLAPVLEDLARVTRERLETEADLRALTAQGRMSAWIVGSLPIGFLAFLTLLTGTSIIATFVTPLGAILLVVGLGLEVAALVWMRRILAVHA